MSSRTSECVGIEIVGRFIEHEEVGGQGEDLGEQQPVALARPTGWRPARGPVSRRRGNPADRRPRGAGVPRTLMESPAAWREGLPERVIGVELAAGLIEEGDGEVLRAAQAAAVALLLADQDFQQGGLAGAIGADEPDPVAAQDAGGKPVDDLQGRRRTWTGFRNRSPCGC